MRQVSYATKRQLRRIDRSQYPTIERNPIGVCSWATDPANIGGLCRLSEAYLATLLVTLKPPRAPTAVGTAKWQPYETTWEVAGAAQGLRDAGYTLVALEQTDGSEDMRRLTLPEKMCLLVGSESSGLPQSVLDMADLAVEIPQYGMVGSLNVVTATAIALYEWSRQHQGRSVWR